MSIRVKSFLVEVELSTSKLKEIQKKANMQKIINICLLMVGLYFWILNTDLFILLSYSDGIYSLENGELNYEESLITWFK